MKEEKIIGKIVINNKEYNYEIIYKKIKNIYLRVKDNVICISAPRRVKIINIEKFIFKKADWIEKVSLKQAKIKDEKKSSKKEKLYSDDNFIRLINEYVSIYSNKLKLYPNKISIKKLKYAWGSCTSKKNISYNYELIYKEKNLIEYVIVHELVHLKYMNHQKNFWNLVEEYIPDYKERRKMLKS